MAVHLRFGERYMKNEFAEYHPFAGFIYFTAVLLISMFSMHPVIIVVSLFMSVITCMMLKGAVKTGKSLTALLLMALMIIIVNPLFNHQGATILHVYKNGNALTLEAVIYGVFMAMMLMSVIMWFQCYNEIMTLDKFIWLFGRVSPHFSLMLSMTFRFIPRFTHQFGQVREAQKCIGKDFSQGNIIERIGHFANVISIMISWSMENSIEMADSMKARGYGLSGRTAFTIYHFRIRDIVLVGIIMLLGGGFAALSVTGNVYFRYYPTFENALFSMPSVIAYVIFFVLCLIPVIVNLKELIHVNRS